jgi:hypothetical protein
MNVTDKGVDVVADVNSGRSKGKGGRAKTDKRRSPLYELNHRPFPFLSRTPGPLPFDSTKSTPAFSRALRMAATASAEAVGLPEPPDRFNVMVDTPAHLVTSG